MRVRVPAALAVVLALALLAAACSSGDSSAAPSSTTLTPPTTTPADAPDQEPESTPPPDAVSYAGVDPAPEFPSGLDWLNTDRPLTVAELEGKVVVLDFWTYGCINCIHIIPDLERLEHEFADELVVIGVHSAKFATEGATENIRQVVLRYGLEHPVVNDREFQVWNSWGARAWPTVVVIDPAGNIVGGHSGEGVYQVIQPVISSLVAEFDAAGLIDRTPAVFPLESDGLPATVLSFPGKVHADPAGDRIFIADTNHNRVVTARLSDGEVLAVYGSGRGGLDDGPAAVATFEQPQGLALSADGALLYVADTNNHAIREIDLATGTVSTLTGTGVKGPWPPEGGTAPDVPLHSPWDLALDGDLLYVAMAGTHQIWTIDVASGAVSPFAGNARESTLNGPRQDAELAQPSGLSLDAAGNLYFADSESSAIRAVDTDPAGGDVFLVAGSDESLFDFGDVDGVGDEARFQHPLGVSVDGRRLFVADTYNSKLKVIDLATGSVATFAGGEAGWADGADPLFYEPGGLHAAGGLLYVADTNNHAVRIVDTTTGETSTLLLKGIEQYTPAAGDDNYLGTVVRLPLAEVAPGTGEVVLDIALPEGYKVNETAPSSMSWTSPEGVVFGVGADRAITGTKFPVSIPAEFTGDGEIIGDVTVIWCAEDAESLCFIAQLRFEVPVAVVAGAGRDVVVPHELTVPEV